MNGRDLRGFVCGAPGESPSGYPRRAGLAPLQSPNRLHRLGWDGLAEMSLEQQCVAARGYAAKEPDARAQCAKKHQDRGAQ